MVAREIDLQARKERILGIAIREYIQSVTPVSSSFIAKEYPLDLSSATIRNVLAELEEEGYLTHPHTSAGRIPTQAGYRFYVDHLMNEIELLEEEKARIKAEYQKESDELETLLEKTSELLSNTTQYTSIVSVDGWGTKMFLRGTGHIVEYPDLQDIEKIRNILVALDRKEQLLEVINRKLRKNIEILIGQEIACQGINSCSLVISSYQSNKGPSGRIAILGPKHMNYDKVISTLEYIREVMNEVL